MCPGKDFVFHRLPVGKFAQIIDDSLRVRPEIVRAVIVHEYSRFVVMIVSIARDMIAAFDDKACFAELVRDSFRQNRAREARAHNQVIKALGHWAVTFHATSGRVKCAALSQRTSRRIKSSTLFRTYGIPVSDGESR